MRKLLPAIMLLLIAMSSGAAVPHRCLVAVEHPLPDAAATLIGAGVTVVRDMERYLLAVVDESDIARMSGTSGTWRVLDRSIDGRTYYTVGLRGAGDLARLHTLSRVLRTDRYDAVVEVPERDAASLVQAGFQVARVFLRPIRAPHAAGVEPAGPRQAKTADPLIQQMVDSVSGANIDASVQRLQDFVTRYCTTDSCQAAANWIKAKFESYGITDVAFQSIPGGYKPNVVATIPGTGDPSRIVVLGAHYDSISQPTSHAPGADDNASGAAGVLETARILSGHSFNSTIQLVAFGAEELGLYGSEEFASQAAAQGEEIVGAVCIDMIGYVASGDAVDLDIIDNTASTWIRDLAFQVRADYVPGFATVDGTIPGGASSDHASFWASGYNAILLFEDSGSYSPYIHTTSDVVGVSYNNPGLALNSVKTAVALIATMAEPFCLAIVHTPLDDTGDTVNPYPVIATITAAGTLDSDSLQVLYSAGSDFQSLPMAPTGNPDEYEADIPAQPEGTFVDYYIVAADETGYRQTEPTDAPATVHSFFVGTTSEVFADDVEAARGWTLGGAGDNATTGIWERGDPQGTTNGGQVQPEDDHTPAPGVMCFATGLAAGTGAGSYDVDGGKTTLLSPVFDLSGYSVAFVTYWRWFSNDLGGAPGEDYWQVQATSDGTNWVNLEHTLQSRNLWTRMTFALQDYIPLTASVRFRFIASDTGGGSLVEAAVDDFSLTGWQAPAVGVDAGNAVPARVTLVQNAPNPFNPITRIRFSVSAPGENVVLSVFDVAGRRVRALLDGEKVTGWRSVDWDGADDAGRSVPSGIYLYRLDAGRQSLSRKMMLLK